MTLQEIVEDKIGVLNQCYSLVWEALEKDPNYTLSDDEQVELAYDMLAHFSTHNDT